MYSYAISIVHLLVRLFVRDYALYSFTIASWLAAAIDSHVTRFALVS